MMAQPIRFSLRPASDEDAQFVEWLYLAAQKPFLEKLPDFNEEQLIARFRKSLATGEVDIIVVDHQNVGCIHLTKGPDVIDIAQLHIMPGFQGKLIGTTLIRRVLEEASSIRKKVTLAVLKGNRAIHLYKRLGFTVTGEDDIKYYMQRLPPKAVPS
jgi:ribosomal protein S18 acetylase RimI-like enzyme